MKKLFLPLLFLSLISLPGFAQILNPVHWTFTSKHLDGNNFEIIFTAKIDKGWHIFSQKLPDAAVPLPTTFTIEKSDGYTLDGAVKETSTPKTMKDADKVTDLTMYEDEAVFVQKVKVTGKSATVKGSINYMKCNERECLPPEDQEFSIKLDVPDGSSVSPVAPQDNTPTENKSSNTTPTNSSQATIAATPGNSDLSKKSLWQVFAIGFGAGAASLISPCVYSMLPLTITFFTKRSKTRKKGIVNALTYAFSIILIFVSIGFFLSLFKVSSDSVNEFASNGVFNFILFLLFVVFAISFFGVFEITLPSAWVNKSESISDKGGLIGIFFMAFTLVLISFSCTVPFIAAALTLITKGQALAPIVGMFAYALAFSFPFALFAFFPHWLHSLPKSGGWLNVIKVSFAFIELALALKFLSNTDLVYHWHLFSRDIFLSIWIIIFLLLGVYLLGFIRFVHDSDVGHVSVPRLFLAILSLSFTLYMIPGLWGAPLNAISAFAPPLVSQEFDLSRYQGITSSASATPNDTTKKKYKDIFHCPNGLNCYFDYAQGLEAAKKADKPIFLDFTGWTCANCRKMEQAVWKNPEVLKRMANNFIVISLYADDPTKLPENEQYVSTYSGKNVKTIGNKNSDLEGSKFGGPSQPYYVLVDHNDKQLTTPRAYNEDVDAYIKFLDDGLAEYKKRTAN